MHTIIQVITGLVLAGCANLIYATTIDSSSYHSQPQNVIAQKSVPHIDTSKCIQNSSSGWISMAESKSDGMIGRSYNPGQCPANYAMVEASDYRVNHGILQVGYYVVRDTYAGKTITCCPVVSKWIAVA